MIESWNYALVLPKSFSHIWWRGVSLEPLKATTSDVWGVQTPTYSPGLWKTRDGTRVDSNYKLDGNLIDSDETIRAYLAKVESGFKSCPKEANTFPKQKGLNIFLCTTHCKMMSSFPKKAIVQFFSQFHTRKCMNMYYIVLRCFILLFP